LSSWIIGGQGYDGSIQAEISRDVENRFESSWSGSDPTRFTQRIRSAATVLRDLSIYGSFVISHRAGVLTIQGVAGELRADEDAGQGIAEEDIDEEQVEEEEVFPEGKIITELHKRKERNRRAVMQKKRRVLAETGALRCEVCGFDFAETYGQELGYGFAECHHTTPLANLIEDHPSTLDDLASFAQIATG
jgi:hypothetical protein